MKKLLVLLLFTSVVFANIRAIDLSGIDDSLTTVNTDRDTNLQGETGLNVNAAMFGRVSDTIVKGARIDASTEALMMVSYEHHEIHEGSMFEVCTYNTLGDGTAWNIAILPPNTSKWTHAVFEITGKYETEYGLYSGSTGVSGGVSYVPVNRNGNMTNTSNVSVTINATVSSLGTRIPPCGRFGDDTNPGGQGGAGGQDRSATEIVLKQGTPHTFRVISHTDANLVVFKMRFYEHANRN